MNESLLLKTDRLSKTFKGMQALSDVNLGIDDGGVVSIIGPNGAGKSTLINVLTGLLRPNGGRIIFKGKNITKLSIQKRVKYGINRSFQINSLFNTMTVKENILLSLLNGELHFKGFFANKLPAEIEYTAKELIDDLNMADKMNVEVDKLSHGEQRLIEITLAIAKPPRLLFLDEPTSGLSSGERDMVINKIKKIADAGTTVVLVEHNMDVVFSLARRIIVLHRGRILADDTPSNIKQNPEVKKVYLGEDVNDA